MYISYFTLGFVCLVAIQANGKAIEDNAWLREKCFNELGLSKSQVTTSGSGLEFLKHPQSPCYMRCFFEGKKLFNSDSSLNPEEAIKNIDEDIRDSARPLVYKCAAETDHIVGRCEKAYAAVVCMAKLAPQIMLQLGVLELAEKA